MSVKGRPSSVLLTILAAGAASKLTSEELTSDDSGLLYLLREINQRLERSPVVPNPVDKGEDLTARLTTDEINLLKERLLELGDIAHAATAAQTTAEAAAHWGDAFEHLFPLPDVEPEVLTKSAAGLPQVIAPDVRVVAHSPLGYRKEGFNEIGPIPKGLDIDFRVTNAGLFPAGVQFDWTVRNTGNEAGQLNDLGHRKNLDGLSAHERSAYNGTHFMDCVARLNGRIIALRRVPVVISGVALAPRAKPMMRQFRISGRR